MEFKPKPMREIRISATPNGGYLAYVGCVHLAYEDTEKLIADLSEYIRDPKGVEAEYNKHHKAYDEVESAPDRPPSAAGMGLTSSREVEQAFEPVPDEEQPQSETIDPAADIESSGY